MLEVKLTDEIMFDLLLRADDSEHTENSLILGRGSDRTAIIYNDFLIVKVPHWTRLEHNDTSDWIKNHKKYHPKSGSYTYNNVTLFIYDEEQTAAELEMVKIIPMDIIKKYGAEIVMWGEWHGYYITFCERLAPVNEDDCDNERVLNDAKDLLCDMEQTMREYPIKVCDLHAENFAYTKTGEIRFCDLGYWKKSSYGFYVDWDSMDYWENQGRYSYNSYNSNDYEGSSS